MIDLAREVARVRLPLLAISACAWAALAVAPGLRVHRAALCLSAPSAADTLTTASLPALAAGWAMMVIAMMSPLVVPEIHHVRFTSLTRRRARSIALFAIGYGGVWMSCGAVVASLASAAHALAAPYVAAVVAALLAVVWQASPYKQICINKCHAIPPLRVFGAAADLDALAFGTTRGVWCAASCGGLMLIPTLLPAGHLSAMAAVALWIYGERLEPPAPPRWKLRAPSRAWRMGVGRLRIFCRRLRGERMFGVGA